MRLSLRALTVPLFAAACAGAPDSYRTVTLSADTFTVAAGAQPVAIIGGLAQPESVVHDPDQDVYFVSNMRGAGSDRNGAGYIVRIDARAPSDPARMSVFVAGGRNGVTLHAPKGLVLSGDVLWVADIDVVRGFDRRTGERAGEFDLSGHGAVMLNALAAAPDGTLYVTDTGITMTDRGVLYPRGDRIYALHRDSRVEVVAEGLELELPNGVAWDAAHAALVVASFNPFGGRVYRIRPHGGMQLLAYAPARLDGLQILDDGRIVTTSWQDHSVHVIDADMRYRIIPHLSTAADLGVDRTRNLLMIPLVLPGRVEIWTIPPRASD